MTLIVCEPGIEFQPYRVSHMRHICAMTRSLARQLFELSNIPENDIFRETTTESCLTSIALTTLPIDVLRLGRA